MVHQAAETGDLDKVVMGSQFYEPNDLRDLLFLAAGGGHLNVVRYLAEKRRTYDYDSKGLKAAAARGHLAVVKYLVESDASDIGDWRDETPLSFASKYGWLEVVEYLITKGAKPDANDNQALIWACETGQLEVVKCLHRNGANIHQVEALHNACEYGHLGVVMYLHQHGVDIGKPDYLSEPYDLAASWGHEDIVDYIENPAAYQSKS